MPSSSYGISARPQVKAKVWADLFDPNNTDSVYIRNAKMNGFYRVDQTDIVAPYFDKFYEVLPLMFKTFTNKKFSGFFNHMHPRAGDIKDEHIVKLVCLKQVTHDRDKVFMNTL
jgi:hypothetical protein